MGIPTHITISGERFRVREVRGRIQIVRKDWALQGTGATVAEARNDLIARAIDAGTVILSCPPEEGDDPRLRTFLRRTVRRRARTRTTKPTIS